jgi:hypothetical protein
MRYQSSNKCAPKAPLCPSCAQIMRLARITSRFDDLPDLYVFECRACGVSHIEQASLPDLTMVPRRDLAVPLSR